MNAEQRQQLSSLVKRLEEIADEVEKNNVVDDVQEANQDSLDNLPEGLQQGEKGEQMQTAIDALESANDNLADCVGNIREAINNIQQAIDG